MTSPIDLKIFEIKPPSHSNKNERREPDPFEEKKPKKRPVLGEVEEETLAALKTAIKKQKQEAELMAASFEQTSLSKEHIESAALKIGKLEPSAQVTQLYGKIADTLTHMHQNGITETTVTLGEAFASSIFRGATLTLTEYSTAPKIFNIQFSATPEAVAFFQLHASELVNALNQGKFAWSVYRTETSLFLEKKYRHVEDALHQEEDEA